MLHRIKGIPVNEGCALFGAWWCDLPRCEINFGGKPATPTLCFLPHDSLSTSHYKEPPLKHSFLSLPSFQHAHWFGSLAPARNNCLLYPGDHAEYPDGAATDDKRVERTRWQGDKTTRREEDRTTERETFPNSGHPHFGTSTTSSKETRLSSQRFIVSIWIH